MSIHLRPLLFLVVAILGVFWFSVSLREPWRGHLAKGDHYVTAQTLRYVRTWHRDGAWNSKFALVISPPMKQYEGCRKRLKWGLPGHMLLIHGILSISGAEPNVASLMRVNLAIHLILAVLLALLAYALASRARPERSPWPIVLALHCGVFSLLFPPLLYWGQNLSCPYFTVAPLFAFCVVGRWLRSSLSSRGAQRTLDLAVAACVFWGTVTEFLFWLLVPYLLIVRFLRARAGRLRTSDPWLLTVALPFALAMLCLMAIFVQADQIGTMQSRFAYWMGLGGPRGFSPEFLLPSRVWGFFVFFGRHFWGAYWALGLLCLVVAVFRLMRRRPIQGLSEEGRGALLDLLSPCLLLVFALGPHQAFHTVAAIKFIPFVALMWTTGIPLILLGGSWRRKRLAGAAYVLISVAALLPATSKYREFFPVPEVAWDREGAFLRQHAPPGDALFSSSTEILLFPPQRISLAERSVTHVYGPLDILREVARLEDGERIAIYDSVEFHKALGGEGAETLSRGRFSLARLAVGRFRSFMGTRPDAVYRARMSEVLEGGWSAEPLRPVAGPVPLLSYPLAMHTTVVRWEGPLQPYIDGSGEEPSLRSDGARHLQERLYWEDDRHFHWISPRSEFIMLGENAYRRGPVGHWERADLAEEVPAGWGRFLVGLFDEAREAADAREARGFSWAGYQVIRLRVGSGPAYLRSRAPGVTSWEAGLILKGLTPIAVVLEPGKDSEDERGSRVSVLFERLVSEVEVPGYVAPPWQVRKRRPAGAGQVRK